MAKNKLPRCVDQETYRIIIPENSQPDKPVFIADVVSSYTTAGKKTTFQKRKDAFADPKHFVEEATIVMRGILEAVTGNGAGDETDETYQNVTIKIEVSYDYQKPEKHG